MTTALTDRHLAKLISVVHTQAGIMLGPEKRPMIEARLAKYIRQNGCSLDDLVGAIEDNTSVVEDVIDILTTNFTSFFRETEHFDWLASWARDRRHPARVWCAACATGEEAYSIAITLRESAVATGSLRRSLVFASDLSRRALDVAKQGIYPDAHLAGMDPERIRRWFQRGVNDRSGDVRVKNELRDGLQFTRHNLLETPPHEALDVIFLRNVMIYFDEPTQQQVLQQLRGALVRGGFLVVGHAENVRRIAGGFRLHGHTLLEKL